MAGRVIRRHTRAENLRGMIKKLAHECYFKLSPNVRAGVDLEDIIQEGFMVYQVCRRRYNRLYGAKLTTFATRMIIQHFANLVHASWANKRSAAEVTQGLGNVMVKVEDFQAKRLEAEDMYRAVYRQASAELREVLDRVFGKIEKDGVRIQMGVPAPRMRGARLQAVHSEMVRICSQLGASYSHLKVLLQEGDQAQ